MDLRAGGARVALVLMAWTIGGVAWGAARPVDALYSSICLYPETDDYGGMEVQVKTGRAGPVVRFSICEGGCGDEPVSEVRLDGARISFTTREEAVDQNGKTVETNIYRYEGVFRNGRLDLHSTRPGWPDQIRLPRRGKPDLSPRRAGHGVDTWPTPWRRCR